MTVLIDTTVRISLIVAAGLFVVLGLGRRSASVRHWVLATSIGCAAATPALQLVLPSWQADASGFWPSRSSTEQAPDVTGVVQGSAVGSTGEASSHVSTKRRSRSFPMAALILYVWLAGALICVARLIMGVWRIARLSSSARRVETGPIAALAEHIREVLNIRQRITLLQSLEPHLLVAWGAVRPKVILPPDASHWSDDRAGVVLRHELAHIARGDWLVQMVAEMLRAIYWFNPLLWVACQRLRDESERACDDVVLETGVRPADYASHLVDLARHASRPGFALGMARSSSLEGRVHAMLNVYNARQPIGPMARFGTVLAFACLTAPIATAQSGNGGFRGAVLDQTNRYVPAATVVLTSNVTNAVVEARTDQTGHFVFPNVAPGDYQLTVQQPGFRVFKETVVITGGDVTRNIHLQIGTVEETLKVAASVTGSGAQSETERRNQVEQARRRAEEARRRADQKCAAGAAEGEIGGEIVPPLKLTNVRPDYPETLKGSGIDGDVTLNALIGTDGTVRDVTGVSSPHPELERVAIEAVRRWEFSTTYLNCNPVEVPMRVTVKFSAR
jgi:TonB family protein